MSERGRQIMPVFRVLHLIDEQGTGDAAIMACAAVVRALPHVRHGVCLIGSSEFERRAASLGLATTDRIVPPLGRTPLAWRGLRRFLRDRGRPDLVHAWSDDGRRLARLAGGGALPCVTVPAPACARPRQPDPATRAALRTAMGVGPTDPVLLLAGEGPDLDAMRFIFLLGLLAQADVRAIGLVPRGAARLARALRFHRRLGRGEPLLIASRPAADLADVADVAVWTGPALAPTNAAVSVPSAAHVACLQAAGVPVVAPYGAMGAAAGLLAPSCAASNATPPELARLLTPLLRDEPSRSEAGRTARDWVERHRPADAFVEAVEEAYRRFGGRAGRNPVGPAAPALERVLG